MVEKLEDLSSVFGDDLSENDEKMSAEDRKLEERRRFIRICSVVLVILCTVFLAVMAGTMIALWDTGKSARDLMSVLNGSYVHAKTQEELERAATEQEHSLMVWETQLLQ